MAVMIMPKEDETDLRKSIGCSFPIYTFQTLGEIEKFLNLTISEAFLQACAFVDLRGIRYRVLKSASSYHSFVSELIRILNRGFATQRFPLFARELTASEAKERNIDKKTSFLIVASPKKHDNFECYGGTDTEILVRLETAECEVPKVMKNSPTTGLVITDYQFDKPYCCMRDFINEEEFIKHILTENACNTASKIINDAYDERYNERHSSSYDAYEATIQSFRHLIAVAEDYIEKMGRV